MTARLILIALLLAGTARAATRVALVDGSPAPDKTCAALVDLAASELTAADGIELLERDAIDRVLAEQNLAGAQLAGAEGAVRIGALLKVDVYAVLECANGLVGAGLVAFDVQTGERLVDSALSSGAIEAAAGEVRAAVEDAVRKRALPASDRRAVCLVAVRNADLPAGMDAFCDAVGLLLERHVVRSPSVTLLERRRLEQLLAENTLTGPGETSLRGSVFTIDLDIARSDEGLAGTALLRDPSGSERGTCRAVAPATDAAALAARLAEAVLAEIGSAGAVQPAAASVEAERFKAESDFLAHHGRMLESIRAAEAAYALDPRDTYLATLAERCVAMANQERVHAGKGSSFGYVARALDIVASSPPEAFERSSAIYDLSHYFQLTTARQDAPLLDLRKRFERLTFKFEQHAFTLALKDPAAAGWYIGDGLHDWLRRLQGSSKTSTVYVAGARRLVGRWLQLVDLYGIRQTWSWKLSLDAIVAREWHHRTAFKKDAAYYAGMREVAGDFKASPHRLMQFYGDFCNLWLDKEQGADEATLAAGIQRVDREARAWIAEASGPKRLPNLYMTYMLLLDVYEVSSDPDARLANYVSLFDFMMERKELVPDVAGAAMQVRLGDARTFDYKGGFTHDVNPTNFPRLLENAERTLAALDDAGFQRLDGGGEFAQVFHKDSIMTQRDRIAAKLFEANPSAASECRKVFSVDKSEWHIDAQVLEGQDLFLAMTRHNRDIIRVGVVRLPSGEFTTMADVPTRWIPGSISVGPDSRDIFVTDLDVTPGRIVVGTKDSGVYVVPRDGAPPTLISMTNGLPTDAVQSAAVVDNVLYLGLRSGYLVSYDLAGKRVDVIASSRRREKKSPFDDLKVPFEVTAIRRDPARSRLILVVASSRDMNNYNDYRPEIGIWELRLPDRQLKQLHTLNRASRWTGPARDGAFLTAPWSGNPWQPGMMLRPWYGAVSFEFATDQARVVYAKERAAAGPELNMAPDTIHAEQLLYPPYLTSSNGIWGSIADLTHVGRDGTLTHRPCLPTPDATWTEAGLIDDAGTNGILVVGRQDVWLIDRP